MPRKAPLPQSELLIGQRLKKYRLRIKFPRRIFARSAGVDVNVLARIEIGRAPLKYGDASKLLNKYNINPAWLATGEGGIQRAVGVPSSDSLAVEDSSLFSQVFATKLADLVGRQITELESSDEFRFGSYGFPSDAKGRVLAEDHLIEEISACLVSVPSKRLNELVNAIRFAAKRILSPDDWEAPGDGFETIQRRLVAMEKAKAWLSKRRDELGLAKKSLTNASEKHINTPDMKPYPTWKQLLPELKKATAPRGVKAKLAKDFGVSQASMSEWLRGVTEPGGEITLRLLKWVRGQ